MKKPILNYQLLTDKAIEPERANETDSGMDVFSPVDYTIKGNSDIAIPLDVRFEIPKGYDLEVYNKSGVATKKKLVHGAHLIDMNYRGNVIIHLFNLSNEKVSIKRGDKIAQLVMRPVVIPKLEKVDFICTETDRGEGGFGSSGSKKIQNEIKKQIEKENINE